jgi:hypothetical protein
MSSGLTHGVLRMLGPCAGPAQECSPSAPVKAAAAHVQRLKRNPRPKKPQACLQRVHPGCARGVHVLPCSGRHSVLASAADKPVRARARAQGQAPKAGTARIRLSARRACVPPPNNATKVDRNGARNNAASTSTPCLDADPTERARHVTSHFSQSSPSSRYRHSTTSITITGGNTTAATVYANCSGISTIFRRLSQALGHFPNLSPFSRRLLPHKNADRPRDAPKYLHSIPRLWWLSMILESRLAWRNSEAERSSPLSVSFQQQIAASLADPRLCRDSIIRFRTELCRAIERWSAVVEVFIIRCDLGNLRATSAHLAHRERAFRDCACLTHHK